MANLFAPSLHGDGIRFAFFHHLWSKNRAEVEGNNNQSQTRNKKSNRSHLPLRIPDTVIFRLGQPLQWYFTSERGNKVTILRKRKRNISVEKIEEEFLRKIKSANNGWLDPKNDIVAYFIASTECSVHNRQLLPSTTGTKGYENDQEHVDKNATHKSCDIEYFNEEGLHDFLYKSRKNQSGILQRFVDPAGGGTNNSQIRAICTPKMCVLERRRTKQDLHDNRFGLYERAVTFEGPEVYSTSLPIRGAALSGQLKYLCDKVLVDVSEAANSTLRKSDVTEDIRMVLNLKLDSKERIWVLYSSSIRSIEGGSKCISDIPAHEALSKMCDPLNIEDVIKLSPNIKLSQNANHDPNITISNKKSFTSCPSCAKVDSAESFHPVPYKTIISHYEQVMSASSTDTSSWPPHRDIIKSAGGVGFGTVQVGFGGTISKEDILIPPVIRHLHKRVKIDGYKRYRSDPLFLHKKCQVCEDCFLAYAKLASMSFQITRPVQMDTELQRLGFSSKHDKKRSTGPASCPSFGHHSKQLEREKVPSSFSDLFVQCPSLPPAIIDPPKIKVESDSKKFMPLPYESIETPLQPLMHMIEMQKLLNKSQTRSKKKPKAKLNPYEVTMKFVDTPSKVTLKKRKAERDRKSSPELKVMTGTGLQMFQGFPDASKLSTIDHLSIESEGVNYLSNAAVKLRSGG